MDRRKKLRSVFFLYVHPRTVPGREKWSTPEPSRREKMTRFSKSAASLFFSAYQNMESLFVGKESEERRIAITISVSVAETRKGVVFI